MAIHSSISDDPIFRHIVESARDYAIFTTDGDGRVTTWNIGAERVLGHTEEEILGRDVRILFTPEDNAEDRAAVEMRDALATGRAEDLRWHVHKDGHRLWADGFLMPLRDDAETVVGFVKILRDRTSERLAEERMRTVEASFRLMVESATDFAIYSLTPDGRVATWNLGARRLFGLADERVIGRDDAVLFSPEDRAAGVPERDLATALREGRAEDERWHPRGDGSRLLLSIVCTPIHDQAGAVVGFTKVCRDVTERERGRAEQSRLLRQVEAERRRLEAIFQQSPSFLAVMRGPDHVFELANERYEQLVGHRELIGKPVREALPEIRGQGFFELLDRVYRTGETFVGTDMRVLVQRRQGQPPEERFLDFIYQPVREPNGDVSGVLAHGIDLTERKRAERELGESEERYRSLFNSIDEGFCVIEMIYDPAGRPVDYRFLEVNPAFEKHTGLRDATGRTVREMAPAHDDHWFEVFGQVARTGQPMRYVNEARALDDRWFDVYGFRFGGDESRRVAVLFNDITAARRADQERERLVAQLREADRRKDEFLAMLAHELRNPLAAIHGAVRMAREAETAEDVALGHEVIERQAKNLSRLIDDLLDVSRITQGKVELKREAVDLASLVDRAAQAVRPLVEQKRHTLTIRHAPDPLPVLADPTRLEQVVGNLLTNAAKYTEPGGHIAVSAVRDGAEAVLTVEDDGVGISAEMLPKVFDLFTQVDPSLARSEGGLGIGLSLVKQLVEMHGGSVSAASEEGRGSAFTVRLPLLGLGAARREPARASRPKAVSGHGRKVLIVDDNADTARLTARLLRASGFETLLCHDGKESIEVARTYRPEVVLLDIGLPGMDGYEVARHLRNEDGGSAALIIGISGYGDEDSRRQAREAGFDDHLVKPVEIEDLMALLT